jgi:hypothetical protein
VEGKTLAECWDCEEMDIDKEVQNIVLPPTNKASEKNG